MQSVTMHSKVSSRLYNNHRIQQRNAVKHLVGGGTTNGGTYSYNKLQHPALSQTDAAEKEQTAQTLLQLLHLFS